MYVTQFLAWINRKIVKMDPDDDCFFRGISYMIGSPSIRATQVEVEAAASVFQVPLYHCLKMRTMFTSGIKGLTPKGEEGM